MEAAQAHLSLHMSKCHIVGNHLLRLIYPCLVLVQPRKTRPDITELEDLKVLRRSPDLLNNCKTGEGQLQLIMKHILFYHIWGLQPFWSTNLNNLTAQ